MRSKYACVTDYEHLYGKDYYAHAQGSGSFDVASLPKIVSSLAKQFNSRLLDVGGGNCLLAEMLEPESISTFTVDAARQERPNYATVNLASFCNESISDIRKKVESAIGGGYLTTCFDVAEHIDIEHICEFVLNLILLIDKVCIISISTRPSSDANRYHSSVLPVETWIDIFQMAGFSVHEEGDLQAGRSQTRFYGVDPKLVAVSHWQRLDPFRERSSACQHYLRLQRERSGPADIENFRRDVKERLDLTHREAKRVSTDNDELPPLLYCVNFLQDWPFLRSIMDVWPSSRLRILIRGDLIAPPYVSMLVGILERTGNTYGVTWSVSESADRIDEWRSALHGGIAVTATEGLLYPPHQMGSLLTYEARKRGLKTICLQHGMNIPREYLPASDIMGAWDERSAEMLSLLLASHPTKVRCLGSPKFQDALLPISPLAKTSRLGSHTAGFGQTTLVALGLHWGIHKRSTDETLRWLDRLVEQNPEVLFLVRPHFEDFTLYKNFDHLFSRDNIALVDEMFLLSIDLPVTRLLAMVDGVISTYSSLFLDAKAARKPVAFLPWQQNHGPDADGILPVSMPIPRERLSSLQVDDSTIERGLLPSALEVDDTCNGDTFAAWFKPSVSSLARIAEAAKGASEDINVNAADSMARIAPGMIKGFGRLCFDVHPSAFREPLSDALRAFLSEHSAPVEKESSQFPPDKMPNPKASQYDLASADLERCRSQLLRLQADIERIYASKSWRLTAPVRWIVENLRRITMQGK